MKNGFFLVAITAILLTSTLASQVYGQSLQITVETDKDMYSPGETITVSGTINKITNNEVVTMKFVKSNGNLASIDQFSPEDDGTWSTQIAPATKAGTYTINVLYAKWTNEITVNIGQGTATHRNNTIYNLYHLQQNLQIRLCLIYKGTGMNYKITGGSIKSIYPIE